MVKILSQPRGVALARNTSSTKINHVLQRLFVAARPAFPDNQLIKWYYFAILVTRAAIRRVFALTQMVKVRLNA